MFRHRLADDHVGCEVNASSLVVEESSLKGDSMKVSNLTRFCPMIAGMFALLTLPSTVASAQSADEIVQKMRDTYAALNSYTDTGVIVREYGVIDRHTFSTHFNRAPRHFLLDFHKQGVDRYVVWGDPDAFHTWWKTTKQTIDYPNPNNTPAVTLSGLPTQSAVLKIPTLLYSKAKLGGDFTNFAEVKLEGKEVIRGRQCYRLTGKASDSYAASGKEVNIRKMTLWIDAESFLLWQVREEWPPMGDTATRMTTTYEPQANPTADNAKFKFTPPGE
jgi:outer membrane lipoprotein-sorting protein